MVQMGEDRMSRHIMKAWLEGRRTWGRPKKTYGWHTGDSKKKWDGSEWIEEDSRWQETLKEDWGSTYAVRVEKEEKRI